MNESKKMLIRYQVDNKGYKSKEDEQIKNNIRARLDTLISILPNYELAEQSNIKYNGN